MSAPPGGTPRDELPEALLAQAAAAHAAMASLWQEAQAQQGLPGTAPLPARLSWQSGDEPEKLARQAWRLAQEQVALRAPVVAGRVYCYHCQQARCEHAAPPSATQVFAGYEPTGRPHWREFFNALLELGDDRVDQLFEEQPALLARTIGRPRLIAEQLVAFGRNSLTYRIVGQVIAGYFPVGDRAFALTVQVVESAERQLHPQVLADMALLTAWRGQAAGEGVLYSAYSAWLRLRRAIGELSPQWQHSPRKDQREALEDRLFRELKQFEARVEQRSRQTQRRTGHAELRAQQQRPAHKALEDLQAASAEHFFRDRKTWCIVVLAARGRAHVFNDAGRHITSLVFGGEQVERRVGQKRFVPLPPEQVKALRANALAPQPAASASPVDDSAPSA